MTNSIPDCQYGATVIVTSDTCHKDPTKDMSGQYVVDRLKELNFSVIKHIIEDDKDTITQCVQSTIKDINNSLVITVGGTGLCPRDVTPEATSILYDKHCTGISTALIMTSLRYSPHAALSRLTAGIANNNLIVNFPGKLKACRECLACLEGFIGHALEQVRFDARAVAETHSQEDALKEMLKKKFYSHEPHLATSPPGLALPTTLDPRNIFQLLTPVSTPERSNVVNISTPSENQIQQPIGYKVAAEQYSQILLSEMDKSAVDDIVVKLQQENFGLQSPEPQPLIEFVSNSPEVKPLVTRSPFPIVDYEDALRIMEDLDPSSICGTYDLSLNSFSECCSALEETVAKDIYSRDSVPTFAVSTMDGYVLNIPVSLKKYIPGIKSVHAQLVENLEEFERKQADEVQSSTFFCYQVNTGGRVPQENFAVIPIENTGPPQCEGMVLMSRIELDKYVREAGSDLNQQDCIKSGSTIGPIEMSIIHSMGVRKIKLIKKPILGVLSTGDELIEFSQDSGKNSSKVVDLNGPLLSLLFKSKGYRIVNCGISLDNPKDICLKIETSLVECDVLVITGGASMGTKDHVKDVIQKMGGTIHFGRVNIKPGKPAALASLTFGNRRVFIFSLPGNPVSAYITSLVLVLPFIQYGIRSYLGSLLPISLDNIGELIMVEIESILDSELIYKFDGRLEFARAQLLPNKEAKLNSPYPVTVSLKQQSSRMLNLKDCNCLILIEPHMKGSSFEVGQTYQALRLI